MNRRDFSLSALIAPFLGFSIVPKKKKPTKQDGIMWLFRVSDTGPWNGFRDLLEAIYDKNDYGCRWTVSSTPYQHNVVQIFLDFSSTDRFKPGAYKSASIAVDVDGFDHLSQAVQSNSLLQAVKLAKDSMRAVGMYEVDRPPNVKILKYGTVELT